MVYSEFVYILTFAKIASLSKNQSMKLIEYLPFNICYDIILNAKS